jgi:hypothetical protein
MRSLAGRRRPEPGRRQLEHNERPSSGLPHRPLSGVSEAASNLDCVLAAFTSGCPLSLRDTLSTAIAFFQWVGAFSDWVTDAPLIPMHDQKHIAKKWLILQIASLKNIKGAHRYKQHHRAAQVIGSPQAATRYKVIGIRTLSWTSPRRVPDLADPARPGRPHDKQESYVVLEVFQGLPFLLKIEWYGDPTYKKFRSFDLFSVLFDGDATFPTQPTRLKFRSTGKPSKSASRTETILRPSGFQAHWVRRSEYLCAFNWRPSVPVVMTARVAAAGDYADRSGLKSGSCRAGFSGRCGEMPCLYGGQNARSSVSIGSKSTTFANCSSWRQRHRVAKRPRRTSAIFCRMRFATSLGP